MNYSKKHIKKITYKKLCGYHNRIVYLYSDIDDEMAMKYRSLYWTTARHYSNTKKCYRW